MLAAKKHIEQLVKLREQQQRDDWGESYEEKGNLIQKTMRYLGFHLNQDFFAFVEERDGEVVATCCLEIIHHLPQCNDNGKAGFVGNVYTSPTYRNQGINTALLHECIAYAKSIGLCELQLETDNPKAISIYQKAGFQKNDMCMVLGLDV